MKLRSGALRMGMSGEEVRALHRELAQLGYAIPEDESRASLFGSATRQAVVEFQQAQGLGADGVVGPKTAERLDAELARRRVAAGDAAKPAAGDGPRDYVIHGKVRQKDGRPAARLDVRAFGVDAEGREELLGNSPSDEAGQYKITYGEDLFLRLRGNRAALSVKMRVFDGARGMHAEWNVMPVSQPNHTLDLEVDWPAAPRPEAKSLRVRGRVSRADGSQLVNLSVRAFDKDLRSEELLGTAALDKEGRYDIGYDASQFRRAEKKSADLIVRVFNHQGKELAASPVRFNAREVETIDIVIGTPRQQSEFGALVALLTPLLDGATLAELSDADVDFLTGETEVGRELVAAVVAAERMAELTQLPAAAFFDYMARRRAGASGDEEEFWNRPEAEGGLPKTEVERFRFVAQAGEVVRYEKTPVSALLELRARKEIFAAIDLALWDADGWLKLARRAWPDKPAGKLQEAAEELAGRAAQVFPASLVEGRLVSGRVTTRAGRPAPGVAVQALHRGPHAGAAVAISAPVRTDAGGLYRLAVDRRVSLQLISPASLRLQVRASAEEDPSKPGLSDVVPAAELPVTLNVTLPLEVGPTEYERVFERLRAAVPDASLASLDKEEVLKWLARASSIDAETVGRFHEAQRLAQQSLKISDTQTAKIPAEVHYALLHPVARDIAGGPARTAERLRAAVGAWVVRKEVNASAQVAEAWLSYREVEERERRLGARAAAGQPATVADILTAAGLSADDLNRYVRILARVTGSDDIELLFESAGISDAGRATIRRANKLAHVVGADPTLVGLLIKEVSTTADDEQAVGKLAARPAAEWERLFREAGLNGDVGELRRRARAVEAALEADNPSAALRGRLEAWKDAAGFAPLRDFLKSNEGVNLRGRGLKFQEFNLDAATPEDGAALRRDLGSLQRLARVSSFSQALQLFEYGYTSARDIASQTLEGFVGCVTGGAGRFNFNADEAAEVYRRARRQYAAALVVAVGLSPHYQGLSPAATGSVWRGNGQPTDDTKPDYRADLETLFGTPDACAVKICQSVLGRPAYFVDLLQLLDGSGTNANPLDVLFTRRRDLGELKLSCENAETLLPYIDLVIELLERDAVQLGGGTPIAQPRYPQTTRGTDDLAAYPEHLEEKAYDNLAGAVFPWALPFSLETEGAAVYLDDLGLTREELMRPLRRRAPHGWQEPEASEIASASLGISRVEREVITAGANPPKPLWEYYGHAQAPGGWPRTAVPNVAAFLRRHKLTHAELTELLDADFVNEKVGGKRLVLPGAAGDPCDLSRTALEGVSEKFLSRFHRFVRLWRRTGWTVRELDRAVSNFKAQELDESFLVRIAAAKRLASRLKLPIGDVLAFWDDANTNATRDANTRAQRARASFAEAAELTVADLERLRAAGAPDPFAGPEEAARFLDALDSTRRRGVAVGDLVFILRHEMNAARARRFVEDALRLLGRVKEAVAKGLAHRAAERIAADPAAGPQTIEDKDAATLFTGPALEDEMSRALGVSKGVVSALLLHVRTPGPGTPNSAAHAFTGLLRSEANWSHFNVTLREASPEDLRRLADEHHAWSAYVRLFKGAWLARQLRLSAEELKDDNAAQAPLKLFPLNTPTPGAGAKGEAVRARFESWLELCELVELRELLAVRGHEFRRVRAAAAGASSVAESWSKVAAAIGAGAADIAPLVDASGPLLALHQKAEAAPPSDWLRLLDAVELAQRLGVPAARLAGWVADAPTREAAADIRAAAASRRGPEEWKRVAPALRNRLREKQRAALAAYVAHRLKPQGAADLQSHYLVDVEMGSQQLTTRMALAVSSVQRFVQRALLGAERDAKGERLALQPDFESSWSWMKSYQTWQTNRKVFLFPENVLAPELRDDKSSFFVEFEQSLSQRDLNDQTIDDALGVYLQKLDEVARMEMMGSCVEESGGERLLHVVARTRGEPHQYYHRTWNLRTEQFSPWARLDVGIEGDWVIPVVLDDRLNLYWVKHTKQVEGMSETLGLVQARPFPLAAHYPMYQDQYALSWSTRLRKGWTPKRTADRHIARPFFPFAPAQFAVRVEGPRLRVGGVTLLPPPPPSLPRVQLSFNPTDPDPPSPPLPPPPPPQKFVNKVVETVTRTAQAASGMVGAAMGENPPPEMHALFNQLTNVINIVGDIKKAVDGNAPEWTLKKALEDLYTNLNFVSENIRTGLADVKGDLGILRDKLGVLAQYVTESIYNLTLLLHPPETLPRRLGMKILEGGARAFSEVVEGWLRAALDGLPADVRGGLKLLGEPRDAETFANLLKRPGWAGPFVGFEFGYFDAGGAGVKALRLSPPPASPRGALPPGAAGLIDLLNMLTVVYAVADEAARLAYSVFPGYPGLFDVPVLSGVLSTDLPVSGYGPKTPLALRGWPGSGYFLLGLPEADYVSIAVNLEEVVSEEFVNRDHAELISGFLKGKPGELQFSQKLGELNRLAASAEWTLEDASLSNVTMRVVRPVPFKPFPEGVYAPPPTIVGEDRHGRSFLLNPLPVDDAGLRWLSRLGLQGGVSRWNVIALYYPLSATLNRIFERGGTEAVYEAASRRGGEVWGFLNEKSFEKSFKVIPSPDEAVTVGEAAHERLDFSHGGAYGLYNWELFYHVPMLLGTRFAAQQSFEKAIGWLRKVFDPSVSSGEAPQRYWRFKHFHDEYEGGILFRTVGRWLKGLTDGEGDEEEARLISAWRRDPLNAHLVARLRPGAYERAAVMRTVETLISWGDARFREATWEAVNEATQLYLLARDILGERPPLAAPHPAPALTYNEMTTQARRQGGRIDAFGNALLEVESSLAGMHDGGSTETGSGLAAFSGVSMLYFGVPANDKLLGYWDTVDDRLYKIRHSLDIHGKARPLIPNDLGLAADAALSPAAAFFAGASGEPGPPPPPPPYRFQVTLQKAYEFAGDVRAFGGALLSALEKRDAEALSRLRAGHEVQMLRAARQVREMQVEEARHALEAAVQAKNGAKLRQDYYSSLAYMNAAEYVKEFLSVASYVLQFSAGLGEVAAAVLNAFPDITIGASGFTSSPEAKATQGGLRLGGAASATARALSLMASGLQTGSTLAGTKASYDRRKEEWEHQAQLAASEMEQHDKLIAAAETRLKAAQRELENHRRQVANSEEVAAFMHEKFTREELYEWMVGQLSAVHFQSYLLAVDMARRAEACYRFERAPEPTSFVTAERWDTLSAGLLAGERLQQDLRHMEAAYMRRNTREFELTKHVSLAQVEPVALLMLRQTGQCYLELPERLFDEDHPGHFLRRLKTVSLSIPSVVGPYTPVNCRLTLVSSRTRTDPSVSADYADQTTFKTASGEHLDPRFSNHLIPLSAIVTSTAQNDGGLFELNLRDERYLPFEGAGAVGTWHIELPRETNRFDFASISDVILHMRYTARDGGDELRKSAWKATFDSQAPTRVVRPELEASATVTHQRRLFSVRHDFPDAWHRFLTPPETGDAHRLQLALTPECFPLQVRGGPLEVSQIELFLKFKDEETEPKPQQRRITVTPPEPDTPAPPEGHSRTIETVAEVFNGMLYASVHVPGSAIMVGKAGVTQFLVDLDSPDALEDLFILCHYIVKR